MLEQEKPKQESLTKQHQQCEAGTHVAYSNGLDYDQICGKGYIVDVDLYHEFGVQNWYE